MDDTQTKGQSQRLWFTSDQHFGHKNIMKYEQRQFTDVQEMDRMLIANFNSVVQPRDIVWHLGDFSFYENPMKVYDIWQQLNGQHNFLMGNHDKWKNKFLKTFTPDALPGINLTFHEPLVEIKHEGQRIVLCHYALRVWRGNGRGTWMLYGHSHGNLQGQLGKSLDVGVDPQKLFPISFDKVKEIMDNIPIVAVDHHKVRE